jgi:hypothetical protein
MLGDECPRDACYYVPLVRPPKIGGETDPKKVVLFNLHLDACLMQPRNVSFVAAFTPPKKTGLGAKGRSC